MKVSCFDPEMKKDNYMKLTTPEALKAYNNGETITAEFMFYELCPQHVNGKNEYTFAEYWQTDFNNNYCIPCNAPGVNIFCADPEIICNTPYKYSPTFFEFMRIEKAFLRSYFFSENSKFHYNFYKKLPTTPEVIDPENELPFC